MMPARHVAAIPLLSLIIIWSAPDTFSAEHAINEAAWPRTDFSRTNIDLAEVVSGGPPRDGIPPIDEPQFIPVEDYEPISPHEPVISMQLNGEARAYPLRVMMWHEIVNDTIAGTPIAVTYCPLCNTSVVFDRRLGDQVLDFGTTGYLRHSDLIMYDRQTDSWWQQYGGTGIAGEFVDESLRILTSRLESIEKFQRQFPEGSVLIPNDPHARDYRRNPYVGYDSSPFPFLFKGRVPDGVEPMMRVVAVDDIAVALPVLMASTAIEFEGVVMHWEEGQLSALDDERISQSRDVGNVVVTRDGVDIPHVVTFAFAFYAFNPEGKLMTAPD
jgi:hypothetical protein